MSTTHLVLFFLLFSIPISIVTGPFLPDISITLSVLIFLYLIFTKKISVSLSLYLILSLIIFLIITFAMIVSYSNDTVLGGYIFYLRFPFFAYIIFFLISKYDKSLRIMYYILTFTLLFISADAIFQYIFGINFFGIEDIIQNRISGFFVDEYILGKYLFSISIVYFYLQFKLSISKFYKLFFCFNTFLISIAIILSGERTSLILFLMFIFIFIFLTSKIKNINKLIIFILIPFLFCLIIFLDPFYFERLIPGLNLLINLFNNPSELVEPANKYFYYNFKYYIDFIRVSWLIFLDNPFFGVGPKMYRVECTEYLQFFEYACSTHPHNIYLQLLAETGIFLFILILFLWLVTVYILFKYIVYKIFFNNLLLSENILILIIAYFVLLFPFSPHNSFFNNNSSIMLYFPLGFLLHEIYLSSLNRTIFNISIIK